MEQSNIVDITPDNFEQIIVEQSKQHLIVIGFWTARDPSCVALMEALARLLTAHASAVIFARIDVDSQQDIAMQFGIQSVPTVALFKDAKPVDSFVGIRQGAELEAFLAPHLPKPEDALLVQAQDMIAAGDHQGAYGAAKKAYELNADRADVTMVFADASIKNGKLDDAEQLLSRIKMVDQDSYYQSVLAALGLARSAADSPQIQALQLQIEQNPQDNELKVTLAIQLSQVNRHDEALEVLFGVLKADMAFGDARKQFMDILATLPDGDPLAAKYRRKLYSLLY